MLCVVAAADVPPSSPAPKTESKMAASWLDSIEGSCQSTNIQFLSQESNTFSSVETRSTTGHLVTLPSASVLLPKWDSTS